MDTLTLSLRQRKLLHMMQGRTSYITGNELAKQLDVSPRTIRNDIVEINQNLKAFDAQILSEKSKGYYFYAANPERIQDLNRIDTAFFTKEDRVRYLALQLCLSDIPINLYDLEEEMYISHTTLEHDLHRLKLCYVLSDPYVKLITEKNDLCFEPDEKKRRKILNRLFHDDWDYNRRGNAFYSFHFLDPDTLQLIMDEIPIHLNRHKIQMEDPNLVSLNLAIAIMYHRMQSGHALPFAPPIPRPDVTASYATTELMDALEGLLGCAFPQEERDEIYLDISSAHMLNASKLNFQTVSHYFGPRTLDMADEYLLDVKDTFQLDFTDDEDFYITLLQYIRYLQLPVHTFNMQANTALSRDQLIVEYEVAYLFQETAIRHLGYYIGQTELLYLAFCISGSLEYLYHNHPETKFRTVITCHLSLPATWSLKRKVLGAFDNYLNITALLPVNVKSAFDFSETDLILSTVKKKITDAPGTDTIQISPLLTPADYRSIQSYIHNKRIDQLCSVPHPASIVDLLKDAYWHEDASFSERFSMIEQLADEFIEHDIVSEAYLEDVLRRESLLSFAFQHNVLFLYSLVPAKKTQLSVSTFSHRIVWNTQKIRLIVMASFTETDLTLPFRFLFLFRNDPEHPEDFKNLKTKQAVMDYFTKEPPISE